MPYFFVVFLVVFFVVFLAEDFLAAFFAMARVTSFPTMNVSA